MYMKGKISYFNTSHVSINLFGRPTLAEDSYLFQYISCFY